MIKIDLGGRRVSYRIPVSPPLALTDQKTPYFIDLYLSGHHSEHQNGHQIGHQMLSLRRTYAPFRLQRIKGKFYLSVTAPKEISHFFSEGRVRRSTGISDRKLAELRAQELVPAVYRDFDEKYEQLDPFVEGLRHLLEREGVDVGHPPLDAHVSLTATSFQANFH